MHNSDLIYQTSTTHALSNEDGEKTWLSDVFSGYRNDCVLFSRAELVKSTIGKQKPQSTRLPPRDYKATHIVFNKFTLKYKWLPKIIRSFLYHLSTSINVLLHLCIVYSLVVALCLSWSCHHFVIIPKVKFKPLLIQFFQCWAQRWAQRHIKFNFNHFNIPKERLYVKMCKECSFDLLKGVSWQSIREIDVNWVESKAMLSLSQSH